MQAAVVGKAFDIIASEEGKQLRASLMTNIVSLREQLTTQGFRVYGEPSAIVAVEMGTEALARLVARRLPEVGLISNLCEFPAQGSGPLPPAGDGQAHAAEHLRRRDPAEDRLRGGLGRTRVAERPGRRDPPGRVSRRPQAATIQGRSSGSGPFLRPPALSAGALRSPLVEALT
jgi:glycine C-acetyltransferase